MRPTSASFGYAQDDCPTARRMLPQAGLAGLAGGFSIALYAGGLAWVLYGDPSIPVRMVAALLLGPEALNRWYSLLTVSIVGPAVHALLSLLFGVAFGLWMVRRPRWRTSPLRFLAAGALYGLTLWFLNFYLFAALFDWRWFTQTPLGPGLLGHVIFFGAALAGLLALRCRMLGGR